MSWVWLAAAIGIIAALGSNRQQAQPSGDAGGAWPARAELLREYQTRLEYELGWPGLADFLTVVAYLESRGRLDLIGDGGLAVGPYQIHPTVTAYQLLREQLGRDPDRTDPAESSALATLHAWRLLGQAGGDYPRGEAIWSDVRAGWAIPRFAVNRDAAPQLGKVRSQVVSRFEAGARAVDLPLMPDRLVLRPESLTAAQVLAAVANTI